MSQMELGATVSRLAEPLVRAAGLELWGVEIEQSRRTLVRVYIDSSEGSLDQEDSDVPLQSATLDQCEDISRQLSLALDVENEADALFPGAWVLEVSSPGMSRIFFRLEQMKNWVGSIIVVRLNTALNSGESRRLWIGELVSVGDNDFILSPVAISDEDLVVHEGDEKISIPWSKVRRAHVRPLFPRPQRPGKGHSRS